MDFSFNGTHRARQFKAFDSFENKKGSPTNWDTKGSVARISGEAYAHSIAEILKMSRLYLFSN